MSPDGSKGIRVHFDIGQSCGAGPDGITDICGNFGGETIEKRTLDGNTATLTRSGSSPSWTITLQDPNALFDKALVGETIKIKGAGNANDGEFIVVSASSTTLTWTNSESTGDAATGFKWWFDWQAFYNSGLMQPRHGLFHWMLADNWNPAGEGYVNKPFFTTNTGPNLPHELGHNLGLHHGGAESRNCKPHYLSLMNYLYDGRFSAGKTDANLDPLGLSETTRVGTDADDISWLQNAPTRYELHDCQLAIDPSTGLLKKRACMVDWNRDGIINAGLVRSYVSPAPHTFLDVCAGKHANALESERHPEHLSHGGAAGAAFHVVPDIWPIPPPGSGTTYLYSFTATTSNPSEIRYSRTDKPKGDQLSYEPDPIFWSWSWEGLKTLTGATFRKDTQPAAEVFGSGIEYRLYVFATDSSASPVRYAYLDRFGEWDPSRWATVPGQPAGLSARDVSLAVFGGKLYVITRDLADDIEQRSYFASMSSSGVWSPWAAVSTGPGAYVRCAATPALAAGPDGYLYMACPDFAESNRLTLYRMSGAEVWTKDDPPKKVASSELPWYRTLSRPAMKFVHHLDAAGVPLANGRGYLALWWHWPDPAPVQRGSIYAATWGSFTASSKSISLGAPTKYEAFCFYGLYKDAPDAEGNGRASPALVLNGERLVALLTQQKGCGGSDDKDKGDNPEGSVRHVPYADGIGPAAPPRDHDDGARMNKYLCVSLRGAACGLTSDVTVDTLGIDMTQARVQCRAYTAP